MIIWIYKQPLWLITLVIVILPIARGMIGNKRTWLNAIMLSISALTVIYLTIMTRNHREEKLELRLLYSLVMAHEQPELYRSMIMNIFLFVPIGLFFPFMKKKYNVFWTVAFALLFSVLIEAVQYYFHLGRAETDDVICNTLGAFVGATSWWIYKQHWNDRIRKAIAVFWN